jgi:hypothetical protein
VASEAPTELTVYVGENSAERVAATFEEAQLTFARPGATRGVAEAVEVFVVATQSTAVFLLVLEKLRRMRLPRVYVEPGDGLDRVWHDLEIRDGRTFYLPPDGPPVEIRDAELTVDALLRAIRRAPARDGD